MLQKKVCILGATGVGKTSLVRRYVEGSFSEKYLTTLGVKVDKKQVQLADTLVQLMLWDMEGIDRYCGFQPKYLRGASAYIIVVDCTRSQSMLEGMEIHRLAREAANVPAVLAINKSDLQTTWHWTQDEIDNFTGEFQQHFNTSAKNATQVEDMFQALAQLIL